MGVMAGGVDMSCGSLLGGPMQLVLIHGGALYPTRSYMASVYYLLLELLLLQ